MASITDEEYFYLPSRGSAYTNRLLVKTSVGKTKRSTMDLPPSDFVYGRKQEKDAENAGQVILNWVCHQPDAEAQPGRDFLRLNKVAAASGCTTATDVHKFRQTVDFRLKHGGNPRQRKASTPSLQERCFGRQTRPSTPIQRLISNSYQREWIADQHSALTSGSTPTSRKIVEPQPTKASLGHAIARKKSQPKELFKIARFKAVGPRVVIPKPTAASAASASSGSTVEIVEADH